MEREFSFTSKDDMNIHGYQWFPKEDDVLGVVQIVHGSVEHAQRYREFGKFLVENGYVVYIHDQRGHGKTAKNEDDLSIFSKDANGWQHLKNDIITVNQMIKQEYKNVPVYMLGHSMGSFLVRDLISEMANIADGVILTGTIPIDFKNVFLYKSARLYILALKKVKGKTFRDNGLHKYIYEDLILTRDKSIVKAYKEDIICGYTASLEYLGQMFKGMIQVSNKKKIKQINKDMPIYIMSGEFDKVAGSKITTIYDMYKACGIKDVTLKIYQESYHEILNETNRDEVYKDILKWTNKRNNK